MAKQAKDVAHEFEDSDVTSAVDTILEHYTNIESERGKFMLTARREREAMTAVYESMAQRGVAQKTMKTEIKIVRALERIKGWLSDLEADERKMLQKLAKAQKDRQQLLLFTDLPAQPKPARKVREPKLKLVHPEEATA